MQLNLVNLVKITESSINNPFKLFSDFQLEFN